MYMSTEKGDRPFTSSTPNILKSGLVNWLTLKMTNFTFVQIFITSITYGYTLIAPEGVRVEAHAFRLDTNAGNFY